jgi:hypothetical protein
MDLFRCGEITNPTAVEEGLDGVEALLPFGHDNIGCTFWRRVVANPPSKSDRDDQQPGGSDHRWLHVRDLR